MSHDGEDTTLPIQLSSSLRKPTPLANRDVASLRSIQSNPIAPHPLRSSNSGEVAAPRDQNTKMRARGTPAPAQGVRGDVRSLARRQRRLFNLTDQVLLKRTQISHQEGNVNTCRGFLASSLTELNAAIKTCASEDWQGRSVKRARKLEKEEGKIGGKFSINLVANNDGPEQKSAIPSKSSSTNTRELAEPSPQHAFNVAYDQYKIDSQKLLSQEADLNAVTDELSNLEYELTHLHQEVAQRLRSTKFAEKFHSSPENLDLEAKRSSRRTSGAGTATPPLVSECFEQKVDAGVYRERLQDVELSFHEGLVERELIAERGYKLDVPDEEFRRIYDERREDLNVEILVAEEKAAELAQRCSEAGLDIEKDRRTRPSEPAESTVERAHSVFGPKVAADEASAIETSSIVAPEARTPIDERPSSRVGKWLRTVQDADQPLVAEGRVFPDESDAEERKV